jgi:hypothetical protein
MEVVLQPSGCHWVVFVARRVARRDSTFTPMPAARAGVYARQKRAQGSLPLTPDFVKTIIAAP